MKRNLLYWRRILSVSILPVLAIAPSLVWNQPGRAQEGERAGLIDASRSPQGMNSLADSESRLKLRCCTIVNKPFMNGHLARSTRKSTLRFTGILPVLENAARCEI